MISRTMLLHAAMEHKKDDDELWYYTGWYLSNRLQRYKEALGAIDQAIALNPGNPSYWYERVIALNSLKDCTVMDPIEKYLELCDAQGDCDAEKTQWVKQMSNYLGASFCKL